MKKILVTLIPCLLAGAAVFFTVNHSARAGFIVAAVGELPYIPGCPLHESCVKALREEQAVPLLPAVNSGGLAGAGAAAVTGAVFLLIRRKRQDVFVAG
ncbi:MAG: hypothetical protein LBP81_04110 [Treponema sp.]|jgi:hypothetical protein|nr:hypothetical protein [Treponema sp.]